MNTWTNTKVLIGFLAGAMVAFVGTYFLSRRQPVVAAPAVVAVAPAPVAAPSLPMQAALPETSAPAPVRNKIVRRVAVVEPVIEEVKLQALATAPVAVPEPPPSLPAPEPPPAPSLAHFEAKVEPAPPRTVTIEGGTRLSVRLAEALSTERNRTGDTFFGTLDQPLVVDGFVIAERGSRVEGTIAESQEAGRAKRLARLVLELTHILTSDGQKVAIHTARFEKTAERARADDLAKVGVGVAAGSVIGAAAGGGKGAAIGAAAGGAAAAGTVIAMRGKPAEFASETRISFKVDQPVVVTEQK